MFKLGLTLTIGSVLVLFGLTQLHPVTLVSASDASNSATPEATAPSATPAPYTLIFSAEPGPDVETLQEIAGGDTTDADILKDVVDYYHANQERLGILWREDNPTRLAGIFSMYVVHISTIYGDTVFPSTLFDYLNDIHAHCGTYTWMQLHIANALGLAWRTTEFVGEHAWLEISVDGQWETFDSTTNTWLSRGVDELMAKMPRQYRQFYTPLLDANRADAREHMALGYDMQRLRQRMPGVGITYMPPGQLNIALPSAYGF